MQRIRCRGAKGPQALCSSGVVRAFPRGRLYRAPAGNSAPCSPFVRKDDRQEIPQLHEGPFPHKQLFSNRKNTGAPAVVLPLLHFLFAFTAVAFARWPFFSL